MLFRQSAKFVKESRAGEVLSRAACRLRASVRAGWGETTGSYGEEELPQGWFAQPPHSPATPGSQAISQDLLRGKRLPGSLHVGWTGRWALSVGKCPGDVSVKKPTANMKCFASAPS